MNPRVRTVVPRDDYKLEIAFTNGEVGVFDCAHLLNFGVFWEFKDISYFKRARVQHGTVVWPHEQDICLDTLYEDSTKLPTPRRVPIVPLRRLSDSISAGVKGMGTLLIHASPAQSAAGFE